MLGPGCLALWGDFWAYEGGMDLASGASSTGSQGFARDWTTAVVTVPAGRCL